jgi:hypothetical protein
MNHHLHDAETHYFIEAERGPLAQWPWRTLPTIRQQIRETLPDIPFPQQKLELFSSSAKTAKSIKLGYATAVVYLHPHTSSGLLETNLCKYSTKQCREACLVHSGRMWMKAPTKARTWKTELYTQAPVLYRLLALYEANRLKYRAQAEGLKFGVRMDGTSDTGELLHLYRVFERLGIKCWDYTKDFKRASYLEYRELFTYSHSGSDASERNCLELLDMGSTVSVVFRVGRNENLPKMHWGYRVIDGDEHDLRFLDPPRRIVGLRLKGTNQSKGAAGKFAVRV